MRTAAREALGSTRPRKRQSEAEAYWYDREAILRNTTIALGTTTGVLVVIDAALLGAMSARLNRCVESPTSSMCPQAIKDFSVMAPVSYTVGVFAGAGLVGTIISGALLGAHRNNKHLHVARGGVIRF